jgi:hypothetical protein
MIHGDMTIAYFIKYSLGFINFIVNSRYILIQDWNFTINFYILSFKITSLLHATLWREWKLSPHSNDTSKFSSNHVECWILVFSSCRSIGLNIEQAISRLWHIVMNVLGMVYLQYWLQPNCKDTLSGHIDFLNHTYCVYNCALTLAIEWSSPSMTICWTWV